MSSTPSEICVLVFSMKPNSYMVKVTFHDENLDQFWKFLNNQRHHGLIIEHLSKHNYIFVCTHSQKDSRCGYCGPVIAEEFINEVKNKKMSVDVYRTSHVGKHQFAANVIVFPSGDWYGYVKQKDVPRVLDVLKNPSKMPNEELADLWRGAIGLTKEQQVSMSHKTLVHGESKTLTRRKK